MFSQAAARRNSLERLPGATFCLAEGNHPRGVAFWRHIVASLNSRTPRMNARSTLDDTAQDAQSQIAALRKQVNALMGDRVAPALSDAANRAQYAAQQAGDYTKEQADVVAEQVRGRPLVAIAIAGAVGYLLGRFIR